VPTLAYQPDLYPEDLLDREDVGRENEVTWWLLYCMSRQEKKLMRRLHTLNVPFYSPLIAKRSRLGSGRIRTAYLPLFGNYVFVYGTADQRRFAQETGCVSRWLFVPDSAELTRDLRRIRELIEIGAPITPEARLQPGTRVVVRSGVFRGVEGVVIRREGKTRLLVAVNFLKQGASVLLDDCQFERLN
jgi:transcription antitermination factor NusG